MNHYYIIHKLEIYYALKKSLIDSTYLFFSLHNLSPGKNKITYFQCYHVFLRGPEESTNHGYSRCF